MMKFLKFALFSAVVLIGYSMWKFQSTHRRSIVGYGLVKAKSMHNNGEIVGRTREVVQGHLRFWEVELPSKLWVGCEKDCAYVLRKETLDMHEDQTEH